MSQKHKIFFWMKSGGSITALEAVAFLDCYRLAARIAELRDDGHDVRTRMESRHGKRYARYVLRGKK